MKAILIARPGAASPLHTLAGLTLLRRNLLTARAAGATHLFVVCAPDDPRAAEIAAALAVEWPDQPQPAEVIRPDALEPGAGPLLVMEVAHVHDRRLQPLAQAARLMPDTLHAPKLADGALGAPLVAPSLTAADLQVMLDVGVASWREGKAIEGVAVEPDWMDVPITGDPAAERRAVDALWQSCRKPIDGLVSTHLNRYISLAISRRIVHTGITPNHISIFCIVLGVLGGVSVAQGSYESILLGAALLKANSIIDGVDGELARVKWAYSKIGELLDSMGDNVANFSFFGALTWVMWAQGERLWGMVGVAMLCMWVTHLIFTYGRLRGTGRGDVLIVRQRVDELATGLAARVIDVLRYKVLRRDSFVMLALVMCALGLHGPLLGVMAIGATIPIVGIVIHIGGAWIPRAGGHGAS